MTKEEVLQNCTIEGNIVKLPNEQLERKLYQDVAKSLELIGGKWKGGKVFGFVFNEDPTELLNQIANGEKRNLKKEHQFFATPSHIAEWLVDLANIKDDNIIIEPSAGQGAIMDAILAKHPNNKLFYCENMPTNITILQKKYNSIDNIFKLNPLNDDFLELKSDNQFDVVIANPPFTKNQDIDHIKKMYDVTRNGGRIISIASKHWQISNNKKEADFRDWLDNVGAEIQSIDAGAFKESGTMISSCIIIINK